MNRRGFIGALGLAPAAARSAGAVAGGSAIGPLPGSLPPAHPYPYPTPGAQLDGILNRSFANGVGGGMTRAAARAAVRLDPDLLKMVYESLRISPAGVKAGDSDLRSYKSFSKAAKEIIQARRLTERRVADHLREAPLVGEAKRRVMSAILPGYFGHGD